MKGILNQGKASLSLKVFCPVALQYPNKSLSVLVKELALHKKK